MLISMKNLNRIIMVGMSKIFLFSFLCSFALTFLAHAQDTSGFISIDCGIPDNSSYTDNTTSLHYTSDTGFIDTGVSKTVSPQYQNGSIAQQFLTVRSFPDGDRNCYTLRPSRGRGNKYLIRARFMYGNYDAKNQLPEFDMYIGVNFWDKVELVDSSTPRRFEIIHVPLTDYISVCLVNKNHGTPFISTLELRPLDKSMYVTRSGSLNLYTRLDFGSTADKVARYKDDVYDRIWSPFLFPGYTTLMTEKAVDALGSNSFNPPSIVMSTAMVPNNSDFVHLEWIPENATDQFYIYLHFAEVQLEANNSRQFNIYMNGQLWYNQPFVPSYLQTNTIYSTDAVSSPNFEISLNKTSTSAFPPIINALEIYTVRQLSDAQTDDKDVEAILSIKSVYGLSRNWQGDPCGPTDYVWIGIICSYNGSESFDPPRIISLNLSSSGLTGVITPFIANLTMLQTLDLSNNNLTGPIPDFLSRMASLTFLNLTGNNFSPVP